MAAMGILFARASRRRTGRVASERRRRGSVGPVASASTASHPAASRDVHRPVRGEHGGKEVRFGTSASTLFATVTTDASCARSIPCTTATRPWEASSPREHPARRGDLRRRRAGLYGMLVFVVLSVFIAD